MRSITLSEIVWIVLGSCCNTVSSQRRVFVTEPQNITVIEGSSVVLKCEIIPGYQDPVYWEINGNVLTTGTTQTQRYEWLEDKERGIHNLKILNASRDDEGTYICFVHSYEDPRGNKRSRPGNLTVIQPPSFIEEPQNKTVTEGGNITLNCHVRNFSKRNFNAFWMKNRVGMKTYFSQINTLSLGNEKSRYTVLHQGIGKFNLRITKLSVEDSGDYRCVISVENKTGHILESCVATLHVRSNFDIDDQKAKTDTYIPTSPTSGTDGSSSTFIIVACVVLVTLVLVVLVLAVVFYITRGKRLKVHQNTTEDIDLTETPRQQQSDAVTGRQNATCTDFNDARAMNLGNSPKSHGQGHSVEDVLNTNDRQGEATYAQVDKRRKHEKNWKPAEIDVEATIILENEPVESRMVLKSDNEGHDRLCGKSRPPRSNDGLVYAELDIATSPTSNQRLAKVSEPPTIYADLKHPGNKD